MKALTTPGLTKLIELIKSTFIKNTDTEQTTEIDVVDGTSIEIDSTPTEDSDNLVTSGGVYNALQNRQDTLTAGIGIDITDNVVSTENIVWRNW